MSQISQCKFEIPGYKLFSKQRNIFQGGGVGLYIRTGINFTLDPALTVFHEKIFESIVGTVDLGKNKKIIIGSSYRPGTPHPEFTFNEQNEIFFELLSNQTEILASKKEPVFIFGDFNIDILKYGSESVSTNYIDNLFAAGFIQTIVNPTRCTAHSATLIDHCLTNFSCNVFTSRILTSCISDHFPILSFFPIHSKCALTEPKPYRNYSDTNLTNFQNNINNIDWSLLSDFEDVNEAYDYFLENFITLHDLYFPEQIAKNSNLFPKEPWFSRALLVSRKEKRRLDSLAASTRSPENISKFKKYRNLYNRILRAACPSLTSSICLLALASFHTK